jgi:AhpD family alkylhydroperoxidase
MEALQALSAAAAGNGLPPATVDLVHLRASQINGCGPCVADGVQRSLDHGATEEQVHAVAAWRETPWFSDEERAALALTEAVTRLADHPDPVPDHVWDRAAKYFDQRELAALVLNIAVTNAVNRLAAPTRQQAGGRKQAGLSHEVASVQ